MGLVMALAITGAALLFGMQLLQWLRVAPSGTWAHALAGFGLGIVIIAYAILLLGLFAVLKAVWLAAILAVMLACGSSQARTVMPAIGAARSYLSALARRPAHFVVLIFIGLWMLLTLGCALMPPDGGDWDGLSQHLAQAWMYAHEGCVRPLWFDHHSQFPGTMQMLYTAGELVDGYFTARLLHWLMGMLSVVWAVLIAQRFLSERAGSNVGLWTAFIMVSTPIFTWLTGVAYVDLGATFFALGALYFFLDWALSRAPKALALTGLMLAGGMTVKMQGLALAGVIMLAAAILTVLQRRGWREWGLACGLVVLLGGPWYLKSYLITGNPVYPFAYELFGGKQWTQEQADFYEHHQMAFGYGEIPDRAQLAQMSFWRKRFLGPREPYKWLIGPVLLTIRPWDFAVDRSLIAQALLLHWIGPLYLPLVLLLLVGKRPPAVGLVMWLLLPLWLWWFFSMQYTRYLLPSLVLLAPLAGYSMAQLFSRSGPVRAAAGTVASLWAVCALVPLVLSFIIAWPIISGRATWEQYLNIKLDVYEPSRYIARYLPEDAVIATYGEPRYYYFERPAIWADPGHSRLFTYETMQTPQELIARYRELGITHVLVNRVHVDLDNPDDWVIALLRGGFEEGSLQQMGSFSRRQYVLLRVEYGAEAEGGS